MRSVRNLILGRYVLQLEEVRGQFPSRSDSAFHLTQDEVQFPVINKKKFERSSSSVNFRIVSSSMFNRCYLLSFQNIFFLQYIFCLINSLMPLDKKWWPFYMVNKYL